MFKHILLNQTVIHLFYYYGHTKNNIWIGMLLVYRGYISSG